MAAIRAKFEKLLSETLAESTKDQYVSILTQLWNKGLGHAVSDVVDAPDTNWVYDNKEQLLQWLADADLKPTTKRNYYNVMLVSCKQTDAVESLQNMIKSFNRVIDAADGEQELDSKEMQYFKTHAELLEVLHAFDRQLQHLPAWNECRPMTHEEAFGHQNGWVILFRYLAFLVMVEQPPIRGDWGAVSYKHEYKENHICENSYAQMLLCINKDKVSKRYGCSEILVKQPLHNLIIKSFQVWPRLWVFPNKFDPGLPMGVSSFCEFLRQTEFPGTDTCMYQGVQLLRASYITWFYDDKTHTLNDKQELARCMRHSQPTAEKCYRKLL